MQDELDELFADLWQVPGFVGRRLGWRPNIDCYRSENPPAVTLVIDLAGVDPADVEIVVSERTVVMKGVRRRHGHAGRVSYRQMEIEYGAFHRRVSLAEDVDPDAATASYERGLLTVVLPLTQRPRTGRVTIALGKAEP
ncbi:MAG TPA: Hsp20/alpha crystallin family protein [Gaiellaceae bacterium]|nr:Hsp20/alpha crystallin family protein [Gaiellaceae bacterium]